MRLPNLSYMMSVGELRYIQAHFEKAPRRNPDSLVGAFLPLSKRLRCLLRGTLFASRVRANPFYAYVLARTKYYDEVFLKAVEGEGRSIVNIGCGSDTRAHRFAQALRTKGVAVVECDQAEAIEAKRQIAARTWPGDQVTYLAVDLNDEGWPSLVASLREHAGAPALIMLEGVSPYVNTAAFEAFLRLLATTLHHGSTVAYDFKLAGVADDFGRSESSQRLFRLPDNRQEVDAYHRALGFSLTHLELSSALSRRLAPGVAPLFEEDCLIQLAV